MSAVDPAITTTGVTCMVVMLVVYVLNQVDRILERREKNGVKVA
jgi:hypothetical protein